MCIITISNTGIFCYSLSAVVLLMKYLLITDTICSYNYNAPHSCSHMMMLKAHAYSKITTILSVNIYVYPKYILYSTITTPMLIHRLKIYIIMLPPSKINSNHTSTAMCMNPKLTLTSQFTYFLFALLCIYSSTIRFDTLHVYKQLCTCLFTCLYKYTICSIVRLVCIIHLSRIMYLFCIQLYYVSFHTVYKMCVYYIVIYYGCVMSTYQPDSMALINLFHIYIIFYLIFSLCTEKCDPSKLLPP